MEEKTYTYLALGDSYTIGESLAISESFPYQAVQLLRQKGYPFCAPEILAKTGWATDELLNAMTDTKLHKKYDFVSVLIGVNNQYRGRNKKEYAEQFEAILELSTAYSGNKPSSVFVLSIPDWGVTPFAEGRDREKIATEIDEFNMVNKNISAKLNVNYFDVTPGTREASSNDSLLALDQLHPSAKEYARWAEKLSKEIVNQLRQNA
jgi:lysophospholipase L1-like esterase